MIPPMPRPRPWTWLPALALALLGCQQSPQEFVVDFEQALQGGDPERVADRLTPESRPVYLAMVAAGAATADRPNPFAPRVPGVSAKVSRVLPIEDGVVLELNVGDLQREWVLTRAGGRYRLDLLATATRRPYAGL